MVQLLALRLADLTRPINVGIYSPIDILPNRLIIAAWKSGNIVLTKKEVQSFC